MDPEEVGRMPFWKKDKEEGSKEARGKEKVNYKARLEHKQYLVGSSFQLQFTTDSVLWTTDH